jgi:hypothetical protein
MTCDDLLPIEEIIAFVEEVLGILLPVWQGLELRK